MTYCVVKIQNNGQHFKSVVSRNVRQCRKDWCRKTWCRPINSLKGGGVRETVRRKTPTLLLSLVH